MKLLNRLKRATELLNSGNLVEAEKQFKDILRSHPTNLAALYSLALVYRRLDNSLLTLHYCDRTVKVDPKFMNGWFGRGVALHSLNRHDEAIESYKRVLHLNPGFVDALNNLGVVQKEAGRYQEAVETYDRLLAVNPADERGLAHKGYILSLLQRYDEAIECLGKLLDLNMEYPFALGLMSSAMQYGCIWHDFDRISTLIGRGVRENKPACKSLVLMSVSDSAAEYLHSAQAYAELMCPPAPLKLWQGEIYHHPKIRIAYVSPDFGEHPVAHLLAGVLEHHDKSRFEIFGFSLVADQGRMRQRLTAAVDRFFDVQNSSSREIAEMIRAMEIDILVDLSGYTQDSRTDMFAYRPAPLQVNYLGYPGTLGVEYMDYILADRVVIPDADHCYYREKVVCLPGSYLPADATLTVADRTPAREEFGLPESGVVFCSFNHAYKINPTMFAAWMRILKGCPGSVLWLMSLNSTAEPNLRKEAAARGIDPSRLVFAIRVPKVEDHLARYRLADLFLDTIPYNAHTTACDALFVGLPVLTCLGSAFPGRVAASLLNAVGMPELITQTMEEYEKLALHLAHNPDKLANIRKKLQVNLAASQLYDTGGYCRNLEAAYTVMWERYQHGQEPAAIEIASSDLSVVATGNEQRAENMQSEEPGGDDSLALAQELFCQGNLPQAEIYARRSLVQGNNAGATGLLEDLRRGYGISEFFELSERALMGGGSNDRFLLIKAWGYGFWSELHHLATQLLLAELTRRRPIILWGKNCLFRNETDTNAFGHFFQEIFGTRLEDVPRSASIYPQKWSWGNICEENVNKWGGDGSRLAAQYLFDRPETLVVSDFFSTINSIIPWISPSSRYYGLSDDALYFEMFRRYLKPVASITARVNSFFEQRMQG